jgi:predicted amidohydrolase YtcJ
MTNQSCVSLSSKLRTIGVVLVVFLCAWVVQAQDLPPEVAHYADLVFYNGSVLTMDRDQAPFTVAEALAVRDGRILAVGEDDRILRMAGPDTRRINLDGKAVMPGIIDTHSHPHDYAIYEDVRGYQTILVRAYRKEGLRYITVNWDSRETALASIKKVADMAPEGEWIYTIYFPSLASGMVTSISSFFTRQDLDSVAPDHPVWIETGVGSSGIANTKMLKIITDTYGEDYPGYLRDEQGDLNGQMDGAIGEAVNEELIPHLPVELLAPLYRKELEKWVAVGVTTLSTRLNGEQISTFAHMDREGELPLRMAYSHEVGRLNPDLERYLRRFGGIQGHGTDWVWMIGISIANPDGDPPGAAHGLGGGNCSTVDKVRMIERDIFPEGKCHWDDPGDPSRDAPAIVNRYGYRVSGVHNFGDKAVLQSLEAYEVANQEKSIVGKRFALDHGPMISQEGIKQAAELGAMWSLQPAVFYNYAGIIGQVWGEEVAQRWGMPTKSLIDAGVKVAYGADRRDEQMSAMYNLEIFVTRKTKSGRVYGEREKIDRATTLLMMTRWGAEYVLREGELGSLEKGKIADLAVLDQNPLDPNIPDDELSEIKFVATFIGGKLVSGSPD